jgi:hypothetical protein
LREEKKTNQALYEEKKRKRRTLRHGLTIKAMFKKLEFMMFTRE